MTLFLGVGAQKAGTTWLYDLLQLHPQVRFPRGKELHFWDKQDNRDAQEWTRLLQPDDVHTDDGRRIRSGEITPAYFHLPVARIRQLQDVCPDVRLFVSLRNPITRAWSAACMELQRSAMLAEDTDDDWFIAHAATVDSMMRSDYMENLQRWWLVFPRDQLLVVLHDDIRDRPRSVLSALAAHLDIDPTVYRALPDSRLQQVVVPRIRFAGEPVATRAIPVRASVATTLAERCRQDIQRLSTLIGRDVNHWLQPDSWSDSPPDAERVHVPFLQES